MKIIDSIAVQAMLAVLLLLSPSCSKTGDDENQPKPPKLVLSDTILNFDSTKTQLPVSVSNGGDGTLKWTITIGNINWISATPLSGSSASSPQLVLISVDRSLMPEGQNSEDIYITTTTAGFKAMTIKAYKPKPPNTVKDIDGNTYNIIQVGSQKWLKENLKVKHAPDGSEIRYFYPNGNADNFKEFGLLYRWDDAKNGSSSTINQGICPDGWRVPNDDDWNLLISFAGGMEQAGGAIKDTGSVHWQYPNVGATNSTGFTAVGAGDKWNTGEYKMFLTDGIFWSATPYAGTTDEICWSFRNYDITGFTINTYFDNALSIRCIKY